MMGDWATGSTLKPLRAVTLFDPVTAAPTGSVFECEVYSPNGTFLLQRTFTWTPRNQNDALTVQNLAIEGLQDIMLAEGLALFTPPAPV